MDDLKVLNKERMQRISPNWTAVERDPKLACQLRLVNAKEEVKANDYNVCKKKTERYDQVKLNIGCSLMRIETLLKY